MGAASITLVRALARRWRLLLRSAAAAPTWAPAKLGLPSPSMSPARSAGYTFSELSETRKDQQPITPNDLVNPNGSCPAPAAPVAAAAPAAPAPGAGTPPGTPLGAAPPGDTSSLLGGGVALGMSECDVVFRAGQPSSVQIGNAPNGDRTAVLTFPSGPRAGIYHFQRGGLTEMDSVPQAPAPRAGREEKADKAAKRPRRTERRSDDDGPGLR